MGTLNGHVAGTINITGQGGTDDYRDLTHKPKINNVTLNGDMTLADLGIPSTAVEDVKVDGMSVVTGNVANITLPEVPVQDVKVDGSSVVNAAGVANITLPEVPEVPVQDVKVDGSSVVNPAGVANITLPDVPVQDVLVDGTSVVDADGNANINIPAGVVLDVEVDGTSVVTDGIAEITMPTVPESLTDLNDIDITTPSNDDVLTYDALNDKWINSPSQGGGYTETVIWDDGETPTTSGTDITLDTAFDNFDRLLFVLKPNASSEITFCEVPVSQLEVSGTYAITTLAAYMTTAYFSVNSTTELHIMSWASANLTQYRKIIGIKF